MISFKDDTVDNDYDEDIEIEQFYYYIEVFSPISRDIEWHAVIDDVVASNTRIRRISIDKFYELMTGVKNSYPETCTRVNSLLDEVIEHRTIYFDKKNYLHKMIKNSNVENISNLLKSLLHTYEGI